VVPSIWGRTTVVANTRAVTVAGGTVRFNAGPTAIATHIGVTPVSLASVAPHAMPQPRIIPRTGTPVTNRPWVQTAGVNRMSQMGNVGSIAVGPQHPVYPRPGVTQSPAYHPTPITVQPRPTYSAPAPNYARPATGYSAPAPSYHYTAPAPAYHPSYSAPAPSYHYSAPAPAYHPTYSAPAPSYHYSAPAPVYHPTYSPPAPSFHSSPAPSYHSTGRSFGGRR
jgi:hypothetical protein